MEGGNPMAFINIPAFLIVVGGTCCALLASSSMEQASAIPKLAILAMTGGSQLEPRGRGQADGRPRREGAPRGPARARGELEEVDDQFTKKGVR